MTKIYVIAHNIRSTHNIGSIIRTCEGLGINKLYITGYSPYPETPNDSRLPHLSAKISKQINKTSLDSERWLDWEQIDGPTELISNLQSQGVIIAALEQSTASVPLQDYSSPESVALLLGEEVEGIEKDLLSKCDITLEIPMYGRKESFNVSVAAAMALYQLRFGA